jgi:ParB family chromosome partitioning protein
MIKSIPLTSLVASERNVRRTRDPAADAQLAADIAARGLLQNLVVSPLKTPRGSYAVEAGGRRLRALQALQADGALPDDHKVACLVLGESDDAAAATEASLAENLQRLAMNPADECMAFSRLIEQGADLEGVARRFGLTVRHVEGRLRLAGLHPVVFAALGAGDITLDAAKAYAATPDQERQAWVFEQLQGGWSGAHPDSIRRMMVSATVPASDRRLKFVGEEAYIAAGGRLERDLFAGEDEARVLDVPLIESLATDKLEVEAAWLANEHGYAFVRATLDSYLQPWRHEDIARASVAIPEPGDEEQAAIEAIEVEIDRLVSVLEDEEPQDFERAEAEGKIAELEAQLRTIASQPPVLDPEVRGTVGFFLMLDEAGVPRLDRTPYALVHDSAEDNADGNGDSGSASSKSAGPAVGNGQANGSGGTADPSGASSANPNNNAAAPKLPQRLVDELAMQRRDILALHVARDPDLAFDLAVFLMIKDEGGYCYGNAGSSLSARVPSDPVLRSAMPEAPVNALLTAADAALDRSWTGHEDPSAKFDAFRKLSREAREAWLGAAVARTLEASAGAGGRTCAFHDHLGSLIGIDVAQHWRPTVLNWFDRVPKALCLAALAEISGPELAARHAKAKKAEIAEACEKVFAGEAIVGPEVKAAARAWVPEPMRFAGSEPQDGAPPWEADASEDVEAASSAVGTESGSAHAGAHAERGKDDADHGAGEPIEVKFEADDPALTGVAFVPDCESDPGVTGDEADAWLSSDGADASDLPSREAPQTSGEVAGADIASLAAPDEDAPGAASEEHGAAASTAKAARPKRRRRKGRKARADDTPLDQAA